MPPVCFGTIRTAVFPLKHGIRKGKRMIKVLAALLLAICLAFPAGAEEVEEIVEHVILDDIDGSEIVVEPEESQASDGVFTPSYGSAYPAAEGETGYWTLPMDITDEKAVWDMLMEPITVVDIGRKSGEKVQTYIYREPDEDSLPVGVVTCESQGVRVIEELDDGWTLIECYSSSFHGTKVEAWNLLVSGYIQSEYLKKVEPNPSFGIVIDKLTQRLYVFQDGKLLSTLLCSTGLTMWNGSKYQPYNETRSGEFLMMSKVGTLKSDRLLCDMAIRFNSGDMIHEVPHVSNADGSANYKTAEPKLGTKCSHGCIRVQRYRTPEGINMKWIWSNVKSNSKVKLVIWEDWQGRQLAEPDPDTVLYYNPNKGSYYHRAETCYCAKDVTFTPFKYSQLEDEGFADLKYCPYCCPELRLSEIREKNETYAEGGDHDELLTSLREGYYEYLRDN